MLSKSYINCVYVVPLDPYESYGLALIVVALLDIVTNH